VLSPASLPTARGETWIGLAVGKRTPITIANADLTFT
jgi:hypothetical protein